MAVADLADFGTAPIELDFYVDAFEGPSWATKPFRNRSGWLMVSEARFPMPFITWTRTLVACVSDHGEVFPSSIAPTIFAMPTSLPRAVDEYAPETLDDAMDDLYQRFLRRTEQDNLAYFEEALERTEAKITAFEAECRSLDRQMTEGARLLRAERRQPDLTAEARAALDAKLARLVVMADELGPAMRERVRTIRSENDDLERTIFTAMGKKGVLDTRYTVRWRSVSRRGRISIKTPLHQEDPWSADAWRTRVEASPVGWGLSLRTTFD